MCEDVENELGKCQTCIVSQAVCIARHEKK